MKVWVSLDAAAIACGADEVAQAILCVAARRRVEVELTRNGSHGMIRSGIEA